MPNLQNQQIQKLIMLVLGLLAIFLLFLTLYFAKMFFYGNSAEHLPGTITVNAMGEIKAVPNIATFSFTAMASGKDVNEAQSKMAEIANKAIEYLKSQGIDEKDIQTSDYGANPRYEYQQAGINFPGKQVLTGYDARETVRVKVRDAAKAGEMLSGVGQFGVSELSSLTFESDDIEELKQQAMEDAIKKAEEKAKRLAKAGHFRIVRLVSYYENDGGGSPMPIYDKAMGANMVESTVPQIQVGENTINVSIGVTYEIR